MRHRWHAGDYDAWDILYHNCCSFADEFGMELTGRGLPGWVNRLPRLLSNVDVENVVSKAVSRAVSQVQDGEESQKFISREPTLETVTTMDPAGEAWCRVRCFWSQLLDVCVWEERRRSSWWRWRWWCWCWCW
ncbi:unnamed protein product [Symbiodinium microadriaticum]|nr:unnamed protein product [Symbiodinium microadriaticum]